MDATSIFIKAAFPTDIFSALLDENDVGYVENYYGETGAFGKRISGANNKQLEENHFDIDNVGYGVEIVGIDKIVSNQNSSGQIGIEDWLWRTPVLGNLGDLDPWDNPGLRRTNANINTWETLLGSLLFGPVPTVY
jgi:hypothetical protein